MQSHHPYPKPNSELATPPYTRMPDRSSSDGFHQGRTFLNGEETYPDKHLSQKAFQKGMGSLLPGQQSDTQIIIYRMDNQSSNDNCFELMEKVGASGRYQFYSFVLWCLLWYITGAILLGTPFLIYDPPYQCQSLPQEECNKHVCQLKPQQRQKYLPNDDLSTVANSFGDYHCERAQLQLITSLVYIGSFFGYVTMSIMVDNIGRKKAFLISYGIATFGMLLVGFSQNLVMVGIGLFLSGYGSDTAVNICFYFITQTVEDKKRQKYSALIQLFFSLGGVVNIGYYYFLRQWRLIYWLFFIAPSVLVLVLVLFFIQQTPFFLMKKYTAEEAFQALKKIATFNKQEVDNSELLTLINKNKEQITAHVEDKRIMTPIDLVRYKSIRKISILVCLVSFVIYALYYGPLMLLDKFNFNVYINALVLISSQLLIYPLFYTKVEQMPRKKVGIILFAVACACSFVLIFLNPQCPDHGLCTEGVFQLIIIFIFRFSISLEFALFLVFCNQVFPTQVRGMGIGVSSAVGTFASSSMPYVIGLLVHEWIVMLIFVVLSVASMLMIFKLPETLGGKIEDEIQQIRSKGEGHHVQLVQQKQPSDR